MCFPDVQQDWIATDMAQVACRLAEVQLEARETEMEN